MNYGKAVIMRNNSVYKPTITGCGSRPLLSIARDPQKSCHVAGVELMLAGPKRFFIFSSSSCALDEYARRNREIVATNIFSYA